MAWKYIKDNWPTIQSRYSSGFLITRLVKTCCENFASQEDYKDVDVRNLDNGKNFLKSLFNLF